ncbi:MAG: AAA family ATPase, partial [Candidatus Eremiobacteraeota bacterium]|nr:AAA family ATPase [Candidatus Eremiobacteraeota bacterium]
MPIQIPEMTVKDEIGRGAGTIVYRALWRGRTVALKVPAQDYGRDPGWDAWFRREGALLACIDHPGVAQVLEVGQVQGRPYLVREYVAGRTLAHHLQNGPLAADRVRSLAVALAGALGEVHQRGLVHRDIKPLNIILADSGKPMLIDFGLATRFQMDDASLAVGTLLYSSPEQARMLKRPVDGRSDLYSLGVVLFECAVGSPPFGSHEVGELLRQHAVQPPADPRSLNPGLEPELAAIILRLLAKDPDDRFQSAAELLGALGGPVEASFETPLLGRQAELAALLSSWQETQSGRGTVVLVSGPAGCGKSRLVREFLSMAEPEVLQAKCEQGDPVPLRPLIAAIDDYLAGTAGDLSRARNAAEEAGPLVGRFSARLAQMVPEQTRHEQPDRFYQAPVDWLLSLARLVGGAVLFLDDLQWVDRATQSILRR